MADLQQEVLDLQEAVVNARCAAAIVGKPFVKEQRQLADWLQELLEIKQKKLEAETSYPAGKMGSPGGATKKADDAIDVEAEEPDAAE